jgi:hypothetical protein
VGERQGKEWVECEIGGKKSSGEKSQELAAGELRAWGESDFGLAPSSQLTDIGSFDNSNAGDFPRIMKRLETESPGIEPDYAPKLS